ncbi:MAG: cation:proton antiporter [Deltaproteobacteria bacterium]|nr:cation:proton antiporter [Deltaproteobacteria bacterium]
MERFFVLIVISFGMYFIANMLPESFAVTGAGSVLSFGFMILAAYLLAGVLARIKLPRITGYILAGMLFGPSLLGFLSPEVLSELKLVDDLALTFIAFAAGGELRMAMLKRRFRSIVLTLVCLVVVVLVGVTTSILLLRSVFPFTIGLPFVQALGVAAICGALAVARSPSSAIAIISETKARGPFTEMVLGVTVAADVLTIFIFAIILSFSQLAVSGQAIDLTFLLGMGGEVVASLVSGVILGYLISLLLARTGSELTVLILGLAFLVTKFSQGLASFLDSEFGVHFHLEPMLLCMTAGFVVQNMTRRGDLFLRVIDRSSLPIYVIFFAISGASLKIEALETMWPWALLLVGLRAVFVYSATYLGGRLSSDPKEFQKASGLGFLTQAGVSLGLAKLVAERFPDFGPELATLLVATIAINQVIGPVGFKYALSMVAETKEARLAKRLKQT